MSGFSVDPEELREYAGKLQGHRGFAGQVAALVDKADVGDKSWGVVGIFVKQQYTQMLGDLKDTLTAMTEGLDSGAEKFRDTAQGYAEQEAALKALLDGIQVERG
ncbi:WXG100 family type VII secretion target [Lentzea albidocapillata]|uniref:Excreted virulence factor EspC, type VII ESX diderm n=1 Tax=Lentzea albidocapillata TaxID=40571 RepID=A0A1W2FLR0_9PSEU|nr:type VII secretion target [Lentzea albidocapillata]SMD22899.1 Excreted virulence factor EspC, type VII ESX diderm [Lentzea albidocapillata]